MKIACQEQLLPGSTLTEKWDAALSFGFDAIELRGQGNHRLRERLPELRSARRSGVQMPTVCVEMDHFIGDFDADRRRDAVANMATQLSVIAEIGGIGAITPASYGMFSRRLPPFTPPRSAEDDREVLLTGLTELGRHAAGAGVSLFLEPLNRYEDHMVNTLHDAAKLAAATRQQSVQVAADTYHMNIEEADLDRSVHEYAARIGLVQVSDSNRFEPGAGHLDWPSLLRSLSSAGYEGYLSFECRLSGPPESVLPPAVKLLRDVA